MSDELFIDIQPCFEKIASLRSTVPVAGAVPSVSVPDVFHSAANESLIAIASMAAGLPAVLGEQLGLAANGMTLGAMDAVRADNPCINWEGA